MGRADMHTHSTVSDGRLSPSALVERAASQGVTLMALTDHDNIGGIAEAEAAGRRCGVEIVPGVEISADYGPGTMHILGLGVDPAEPGLLARLDFLQGARRERNPKIIQKLRAAGLDIHMAEVEALAGQSQVGRPHFAQALVMRGMAADFKEAFDKFLAKGRPAYVPKSRMAPREAIEVIHKAGGLAVLAHPVQLRLDPAAEEAEITGLKGFGLDGIEVRHIDHGPADEARYQALAKLLELRLSGGSDYHGIPGRKGDLGSPGLEIAEARALLSGAAA